ESEFSGNLVEVCPTGVFTDATLKKHYTRKWDLQFAPSVCVHCATGCSVSHGERYGTVRRIVNRYNGEVNGWFLCDRGRFGYEFVNSDQRLRTPLLRKGGQQLPLEGAEAAATLGRLVGQGRRVLGIGSPRASLEANFALRTLAGPERFFAGVAERPLRLITRMLSLLRQGPAHTPSLREIESCDAVLVLGEDVTNAAPRMALSLRQSSRRQPERLAEQLRIPLWLDQPVRELTQELRGPLFIATPEATPLDDAALETFRAAPDELARLGFAVAHLLDAKSPEVPGASEELLALAGRVAAALGGAKKPLVVCGPSCGSEKLLEAAANVAWALCQKTPGAALAFTAPECNSFGLGLFGAGALEDAARAVREGGADVVVVLENDLASRVPPEVASTLLRGTHQLVVLDSFSHATAAHAELLLPAASFAEGEGTLVSSEGRAQRFFAVLPPTNGVRESWRWLRDGLRAAGRPGGWDTFDELVRATEKAIPALEGIRDAAPEASFRAAEQKVPRAPNRESGRTAKSANLRVQEPKPPDDPSSALSFSMEGNHTGAPAPLTAFFWAPGWNSIQATLKFQDEVGGPLRGGDPGVRLLAPAKESPGYFAEVPAPFTPRSGEWLLLPLQRIFGSDELSRHAPAIAQRIRQRELLLNPEDAAGLGVGTGRVVSVRLDGVAFELPVTVSPGLPAGVAGLPLVVSTFEGLPLPAWVHILRAP
ncbi:MAG: molybdopterin-dependent oxidoreductase, partial [Myxococcaceae bacterium]